MTRMFKYPLQFISSFQQVEMPRGAEIRFVHEQDGQICLWAQVDPDSLPHYRAFWVIGTGQEIPKMSKYVGTAMVGPFVWHVFEVI